MDVKLETSDIQTTYEQLRSEIHACLANVGEQLMPIRSNTTSGNVSGKLTEISSYLETALFPRLMQYGLNDKGEISDFKKRLYKLLQIPKLDDKRNEKWVIGLVNIYLDVADYIGRERVFSTKARILWPKKEKTE